MSNPTGKLAFAYNTIARLEARIKELENRQLPQDVEEFIAENAVCRTGTNGEEYRTIDADDLRAWMTGHVRVPVEPTEAMIEAGCKQHECQQQDTWYSNSGLSEYDCEEIYKAMISACKGE